MGNRLPQPCLLTPTNWGKDARSRKKAPGVSARFERSQLTARLNHPNTIAVDYRHWTASSIMRAFDGINLEER